jgi:dihydrofolate reductase
LTNCPDLFIDEMEFMIIPITQGTGKRLFENGTIPASFKVTSSLVAPKGIICVTYERDGEVKTGAPQIKEDN